MTKKPDPLPSQKPLVFVPSVKTIAELVNRLAADTNNIGWSDHAFKRMAERGITDVIAVDVLRLGYPNGDIEPGKNPGEWKIKMVRPVKGRREVGVVVLTVRNARLLVKTVEWEDLT
jgi:hypothetical protein